MQKIGRYLSVLMLTLLMALGGVVGSAGARANSFRPLSTTPYEDISSLEEIRTDGSKSVAATNSRKKTARGKVQTTSSRLCFEHSRHLLFKTILTNWLVSFSRLQNHANGMMPIRC